MGWQARLRLAYAPEQPGAEWAGQRTVLRQREHYGPLRVQRSFHPEGPVCHSYLLHPPGGVVGGDSLDLQVQVQAGAHALLTTPAATKFYRTAEATAVQQQSLRVAAGGSLEWLPQLSIVQGGAQVRTGSHFSLDPAARLLAWDFLGLGRPGSNDRYAEGGYEGRLRVDIAGRPEWHECQRIAGGSAGLHAPWGWRGRGYQATLLAWPTPATLLEDLRRHWELGTQDGLPGKHPGSLAWTAAPPGIDFASTWLVVPTVPGTESSGLLMVRWLAVEGEDLWRSMVDTWQFLRPHVLGRPASLPRIWAT
jgi:urease accessory protein